PRAAADSLRSPLSLISLGRRVKDIELDAGLYLEDRATRLAWDTSPGELRRRTSPDYCAAPEGSPQSVTLAWNDRVFGGLQCQVTAAFEHGRENLCGVRLVFRYPEGIPSIPAGFQWLCRQLTDRFGPPLSMREDGEHGQARWRVGGVCLRHQYSVGLGGG